MAGSEWQGANGREQVAGSEWQGASGRERGARREAQGERRRDRGAGREAQGERRGREAQGERRGREAQGERRRERGAVREAHRNTSCIKMLKSSGPRIDPWSTSDFISCHALNLLFTLVCCFLNVR